MKLIENFNVAYLLSLLIFSSAFNKNTHEYVEHNELYIAAIFFKVFRFVQKENIEKKKIKRRLRVPFSKNPPLSITVPEGFAVKTNVLERAALRNLSFLAYLNPWRNNGSYWMAEIERTGKP